MNIPVTILRGEEARKWKAYNIRYLLLHEYKTILGEVLDPEQWNF